LAAVIVVPSSPTVVAGNLLRIERDVGGVDQLAGGEPSDADPAPVRPLAQAPVHEWPVAFDNSERRSSKTSGARFCGEARTSWTRSDPVPPRR